MSKKGVSVLVWIIFTVLFSNSLWSLPKTSYNAGSPYIKTWTPNHYKAASQNWAIEQDSRGILYFGNNEGVLIHNGNGWDVLPTKNETTVRSLAIDDLDRLYIGAIHEFGYMAYSDTGKPVFIPLSDKLENKYKNFGEVENIFITDYGIYFCALEYIFIYRNNSFEIIKATIEHTSSVIIDEKKIITFIKDVGLAVIEKDKITRLPGTNDIHTKLGDHFFLLSYSDSVVLLGGSNGGMYLYDISKETLTKFKIEMETYGRHNGLVNGIKLNNNRFAFTTLRGGVFILDKEGNLDQIINSTRGLPDNQNRDGLLVDRDGNLWTCFQTGICFIETGMPVTKFGKESGIDEMIIKIQNSNGIIYAATQGGLYCLPDYEMQLENDAHGFQQFYKTNYGIWGILQLDEILIAGDNNKLVAVKDKEAYEISMDGEYGLMMALAQSKKYGNYIFAGTRNQGLVILEIAGYDELGIPKLKTKKILKEFEGQMTFQITSDKKGDLLVNMYSNGVWHIRFTGDSVLDYEVEKYDTDDGLPSLNWNMPVEMDGKVVARTENGIYNLIESGSRRYRFELDNSLGKSFTETEIIHSNRDKKGRLWVLYSDKEKNIRNRMALVKKNNQGEFYFDDTLFSRLDDRVIVFTIDDEGVLWLGGTESIMRFDPNQEYTIDTPYLTNITKVTNNREDVIFNGTYYDPGSMVDGNYTIPLNTQPNALIKKFPYENNSFIFEYSSPWFVDKYNNTDNEDDKTQYSFKLEGYDEEWSSWSDETKKEYTNLPDKKYTFKVKTKNVYAMESEVAEYSFTVKVPWYRHPIALILYVLAFIGFVILAVWLVNRRLIAAKERLEKIVAERTKDLAEEKSKSEALLLNVLPEPIAARLKTGEKTIVDKFNEVSVLFADIAGFTKMAAKLGPDKLVETLNKIFFSFDMLTKKYNIEKIKTIGDCYMTAGGVPVPFDEHLYNTAHLALDMLHVMREIKKESSEEIDMRIGIACGPVVAGIIGTEKFIYDLWGDTVNTASRMESHGGLGKIHVTEFVYEKLKENFEFEYRGDIEIKGKGKMKTYFLTNPKDDPQPDQVLKAGASGTIKN